MTEEARSVIVYGAGPIGLGIAAELLRRGARIAGAIDTDPEKAGRDLGELLSGSEIGARVSADPRSILRRGAADVVVHATTSGLEDVVRQLEPALQARIPVVSTCEELSYPDERNPALTEKLNRLAKWYGVPVLGAGINPGFVMDKLPITLMAACREVRAVGVRRIIDASDRRGPCQEKIGHGMTLGAFEKASQEGAIGHVGLEESAGLIARAAGFEISKYDTTLEPVIGPGGKKLIGLAQSVIGYEGRHEVLFLEMRAQVGGVESLDEVIIDGVPEIEMRIPGGIHGDEGTVAVVVNAIPSLLSAAPGLHSIADLPLFPLFPGLAVKPKPAARAAKKSAKKSVKKAPKKAARKVIKKAAKKPVRKTAGKAAKKTGKKPARKKSGSR